MFDVQERLLNRDIDLQTISFDTLLSLDFDTINRILALKREESFMFLSEALNAGKD